MNFLLKYIVPIIILTIALAGCCAVDEGEQKIAQRYGNPLKQYIENDPTISKEMKEIHYMLIDAWIEKNLGKK